MNDALMVMAVGMTGVFLSLLALAGLIWLVRTADEKINARRIQKYTANIAGSPEQELNDELVAVIAAAAAVAIRRPVVIRRVRFLQGGRSPTWAVTGRLNVMASRGAQRRKS